MNGSGALRFRCCHRIPEPTESGLVFPPLRIQARPLPAGMRNSSGKSQKNPALGVMLSWELLLGLPGGIRGPSWHSRCFVPGVSFPVFSSTGKWVFPGIFVDPVAGLAKILPLPRDDFLENPRKLQVERKVRSGKFHPGFILESMESFGKQLFGGKTLLPDGFSSLSAFPSTACFVGIQREFPKANSSPICSMGMFESQIWPG